MQMQNWVATHSGSCQNTHSLSFSLSPSVALKLIFLSTRKYATLLTHAICFFRQANKTRQIAASYETYAHWAQVKLHLKWQMWPEQEIEQSQRRAGRREMVEGGGCVKPSTKQSIKKRKQSKHVLKIFPQQTQTQTASERFLSFFHSLPFAIFHASVFGQPVTVAAPCSRRGWLPALAQQH